MEEDMLAFANDAGIAGHGDDIRAIFVDDDNALVELTSQYCQNHGIAVVGAGDAPTLEKLLEQDPVDVVLLDVGLPGEDGLSICRRLRVTRPDLPIILVSGRSDDIDRILGLELGADDYVTKPFVSRELVARIRALYRRSRGVLQLQPVPSADVIHFKNFELDLARRELRRAGSVLAVTSAEFDLLAVLAKSPGVPVSRSAILLKLGEENASTASERGIDVTIVRLRKLLEKDPKSPSLIKTVWGVGYVFTP